MVFYTLLKAQRLVLVTLVQTGLEMWKILLCGGGVSWKSQKQRCDALSTAEAEYVVMASATQELIWLR